MKKLICIITGPEHNGTTFFQRIVFSHPDIFGGFETGFLLNEDFNVCKPFCEWIYRDGWDWGLSREVNLTNKSFKEKYDLLFKHKGSYSDPIQKLIYESKYLVDKTPAYIKNLEFVRKNTPTDIPIMIVIKKLEDDYIGKIIKRNERIDIWEHDTELILNSLKYIETTRRTHKNIFLFNFDDIQKYTDNFIEKIKSILQYKINTNVEMSVAAYIKKIREADIDNAPSPKSIVDPNWEPNELKSDQNFQKYKNLQTEYDKLINKLKEPLSDTNLEDNLCT